MKKYWKTISWSILILFVLLMPENTLRENHFLNIEHIDKIAHFLLFGILELLILVEGRIKLSIPLNAAKYSLICILFGAFTEMLQLTLSSDRTASWYDLMADILGVVVVLGIFLISKKTKYRSSFETF